MVNDITLFYKNIKEKINALTPSTFSTDFFKTMDKAEYMGEKADIPVYFRHYDITTTSNTQNDFSGNASYQSKTVSLIVNLYYSELGAKSILGDDTIDFNAFALNDVEDIEAALMPPMRNDSGSTARLIRKGALIDTVDKIIVVSITYDMICFLVGTQQLPALYIGPDVATTQDAGNPQYIVAHSDKNCTAAISVDKAGLTIVEEVALVANQPQIIAVSGSTVDNWTITLTALGESVSCGYQIYQSRDLCLVGPDIAIPNDIWTYNLAVAASEDGILPVVGSANLVVPENVLVTNGKGIIPVTITSRGSHSVSVGGDVCNLTSATPSTKVPMFANELKQDWAGGQVTPRLAGAVAPHSPLYYMGLTIPEDNIKKFTIAFRVYFTATTWATASYYFIGTPFYVNTNYPNWTLRPANYVQRTFILNFRNVQNTLLRSHYIITSVTQTNLDAWNDILMQYEYNVITKTGTLKGYTNGNLVNTVILGADDEIGYYNSSVETKDFSIAGAAPVSWAIYDMYIANDIYWDSATISKFFNKETVDSANITIHWPMQKNTDLPYLVDYDRKNNVPLYIPGPHPNLEWVAKP